MASLRSIAPAGRWRPYLLLVALAVVWGVHWPISKIGLRDVPPFAYGTLRVLLGLVTVLAILAARRQLRLPHRADVPVVLSVGIGQMAAGIALMNLALQVVAAGRSSILVYTMPLWVAVIELGRGRGALNRATLGGLVAGLAGIAILLNPAAIDWTSTGQLLGTGGLLLSAVVWAATTIHLRRHVWRGNPLDLEPWQLAVAAVPLAVGAAVLEMSDGVQWTATAILAVAYSGVVATALAFWLSQSISRSLSPLATTMGFLGVPIVGLVSSWLLLGEPLGAWDAVGVTATFAGILVVSMATASTPREAAAPAQAGVPEA